MDTIAWWQDKAVVTGILTALVGIYLAIRTVIPSLPMIDPGVVGLVIGILSSIGIFGNVTRPANLKIGLKTTRR